MIPIVDRKRFFSNYLFVEWNVQYVRKCHLQLQELQGGCDEILVKQRKRACKLPYLG